MMQNSGGNSVPHCVDCFTQFEYSQYSPAYDSKQSHLHVVVLLKYYLNFLLYSVFRIHRESYFKIVLTKII